MAERYTRFVRHPVKRTLAIGTLLALAASSAAGWAMASHLATEEHHAGNPWHPGVLGLEMALHGHGHADGTTPHGHPVMASVAAPIPGNVTVQASAIMGGTHAQVVLGPCARRSFSTVGPTHDRPPRFEALSVLRI